MQILLRQHDGKYYVWKDAIYRAYNYYIDDGTTEVCQHKILAIKDDNRNGYVQCNHCGALVKDDPESIEAHFAEQEAKKNCFICNNLKKSANKTLKQDFTNNGDGTYNVTETYNATLKCGVVWYNAPRIDTPDARKICIFYNCRRKGMSKIDDVFMKYPDLFSKQISVDALNANGFAYETKCGDYFEYDLKVRNTVKACVNIMGVVDHFKIKCRSGVYNAYYSAKYDKLFFCLDGYCYTEELPYNMTDNKYNQAKAKISALYKEEQN